LDFLLFLIKENSKSKKSKSSKSSKSSIFDFFQKELTELFDFFPQKVPFLFYCHPFFLNLFGAQKVQFVFHLFGFPNHIFKNFIFQYYYTFEIVQNPPTPAICRGSAPEKKWLCATLGGPAACPLATCRALSWRFSSGFRKQR